MKRTAFSLASLLLMLAAAAPARAAAQQAPPRPPETGDDPRRELEELKKKIPGLVIAPAPGAVPAEPEENPDFTSDPDADFAKTLERLRGRMKGNIGVAGNLGDKDLDKAAKLAFVEGMDQHAYEVARHFHLQLGAIQDDLNRGFAPQGLRVQIEKANPYEGRGGWLPFSVTMDIYGAKDGTSIDLTDIHAALYERLWGRRANLHNGVFFGMGFVSYDRNVLAPGAVASSVEYANAQLRVHGEVPGGHLRIKVFGKIGVASAKPLDQDFLAAQAQETDPYRPTLWPFSYGGEIELLRALTVTASSRRLSSEADSSSQPDMNLSQSVDLRRLRAELDIGRVVPPLQDRKVYLFASLDKRTGEARFSPRDSKEAPAVSGAPPAFIDHKRFTFGIKWLFK